MRWKKLGEILLPNNILHLLGDGGGVRPNQNEGIWGRPQHTVGRPHRIQSKRKAYTPCINIGVIICFFLRRRKRTKHIEESGGWGCIISLSFSLSLSLSLSLSPFLDLELGLCPRVATRRLCRLPYIRYYSISLFLFLWFWFIFRFNWLFVDDFMKFDLSFVD